MSEIVGMVQESLQIFIRSLGIADAPVGDFLGAVVANVPVARAGIVNPDLVPRAASQHVADGFAVSFAEEIPQGDVDGRVSARLDACGTPAQIVLEIAVDAFDLKWIAADQLGRDRLVNIRFDGCCAHEGFAKANETFVGVEADPDDVCEFLETDGLDACDLHGILVVATLLSLSAEAEGAIHLPNIVEAAVLTISTEMLCTSRYS